jgi:hypothetical protein
MLRIKLLPLAFSLAFAIADFNPVLAFPIAPQILGTATATSTPDIDLVRFGGRGRMGGGYRGFAGHRGMGVGRGGYGYHRGVGVAHRGYGIRGGGMYRGYGVRRAAVGRYRVGGRYYGGVWYGTGRRFWRGRWWAYGVGSCWRASPIGYVWICG